MRILYGGVDFKQEERDAINRVLDKNWWGLAEEGDAFEKELAEKQGVKHAVFVSSGSAALELGIASLKLPKGSEVIVPATTFPTPIASLIRNGLVPVVVDVDNTLCLDPEAIIESITDKTKAILMVYVAGNPGQLDKILRIVDDYKLKLIEDNCDGFGGTYDGKMLGSFGEFSAISMHAAHIIATGQGGAVFTDNDELAQTVREMRDWGRTIKHDNGGIVGMPKEYYRYTYMESGYNYQPLELQAAMGRVQLRKLPIYKEKRKKNFKKLYDALGHFTLPFIDEKSDPCWHTIPIRAWDRPALIEKLNKAEIDWRPILAGNIAKQPAYRDKVVVRGSLENADVVFDHGVWLSVHPNLTEEELNLIIQTCTK